MVALKIANSSISCVDDIWSTKNINIALTPARPEKLRSANVKEIVMRSFTEYLNRPGHVLLPDGMIIAEEFERERNNPLLRVRMLWKYWHGTWGLPASGPKHVSHVLTAHPV